LIRPSQLRSTSTVAFPANLPLIIWVHGGAFWLGSKADKVPLTYLAEGYAIASINYRLSQHAISPAQIQDCRAAVRWLRGHAGQFGFDPRHVGAWGESAGGHLVAIENDGPRGAVPSAWRDQG
jgi:acetyl esterase/lipase